MQEEMGANKQEMMKKIQQSLAQIDENTDMAFQTTKHTKMNQSGVSVGGSAIDPQGSVAQLLKPDN